jgi:hypothetical protein
MKILSYLGPNNTFLYLLPEALAEGKFAIHPSSGSISVAGGIDRETQTEYNLTVYLHDPHRLSLIDTTTVLVRVLDLNGESHRSHPTHAPSQQSN